jgi:hypothetical protein
MKLNELGIVCGNSYSSGWLHTVLFPPGKIYDVPGEQLEVVT